MGTSSKVVFNLETLKKKSLEAINLRIENAREDLRYVEDPDLTEEELVEWRKKQELRVHRLLGIIGGLRDEELCGFRTEPPPINNPRDLFSARRNLNLLLAMKAQIEAKSGSVVCDEDGNVSLTKTQLSEFFGV